MKFKSIWSCDEYKNKTVPAGTIVVFPYVWGYLPQGLTPSKDIKINVETESTYGESLALVEHEALAHVQRHGADDIRQYFIEGVTHKNGMLIFSYGT